MVFEVLQFQKFAISFLQLMEGNVTGRLVKPSQSLSPKSRQVRSCRAKIFTDAKSVHADFKEQQKQMIK